MRAHASRIALRSLRTWDRRTGQILLESILVFPLLAFLAVAITDLSGLGVSRIKGIAAARSAAWAPREPEAEEMTRRFFPAEESGEGRARIAALEREPGGRRARGGNVRAGNPGRSAEAMRQSGLGGAGAMLGGALNALYVTRRATLDLEIDGVFWSEEPWTWQAAHTVDTEGRSVKGVAWFRKTMRIQDPPKIRTSR
ncbi:MAG: hypothetical protein HY608_08180 [Planctomycetes bacterium]|nr:hypothetical protein [Planctomycetota bacterium]